MLKAHGISFDNIMGGGSSDPDILDFDFLRYIAPSGMICAYYNNDGIKAANFPDCLSIGERGAVYDF